jgi:hypothetical protein
MCVRQVQLNLQILGTWIANINKHRRKKWFAKGDLQNTQASVLPKQLASYKLFQQILETAKSMGQSGFAINVVLILAAAALHVDQCLRRIFRILISHP